MTMVIIMKYYIFLTAGGSPVHSHKEYEISICTKGKGIYRCENKTFEITPGKIIITPPFIPHEIEEDEDYERIRISSDFKEFFKLDTPVVLSGNKDSEGTVLAKLIYENRHSSLEYINALCSAFAHFVLQNIHSDNQLHSAIKEISKEISENFSDLNIDISKILDKSGYAQDYIRNHFKKTTGKTPVEFMTEIRISHACYLIDTYQKTLSFNEIAEKCGYSDYAYFSRRFKQFAGMSPRKYLDMHNE